MIVLVYIFLGGLTSAIYNEVLQFFLIVLGFLPVVLLGLKDIGGWSGLVNKLNVVAASSRGYPPGNLDQRLGPHDRARTQPHGRRAVRHGDGPGIRARRSATGVRTSWWCSERWRPSRCRPPGGPR